MHRGRRLVFLILLFGMCGCIGSNHKVQSVQGRGGNFLSAKVKDCEREFANYFGIVKGSIVSNAYERIELNDFIYHVYDVNVELKYAGGIEEETISLYIPYAYVLFLEDGYVPNMDMKILDAEEVEEGTYFTISYIDDAALRWDEPYVFMVQDILEDGYVVSNSTSIYQLLDDEWIPWISNVDVDHEYTDWQEAMLDDEMTNVYTWDMLNITPPGDDKVNEKICPCL